MIAIQFPPFRHRTVSPGKRTARFGDADAPSAHFNPADTKAGLVPMSRALAQEVAPRGVAVNVMAPGFIDTAMTRL